MTTTLTWLTLAFAWWCGCNGCVARLEFSFHMVITSRNFIWLTSLVRIILPSCYKPRPLPVIPVEQKSWYIILITVKQNPQNKMTIVKFITARNHNNMVFLPCSFRESSIAPRIIIIQLKNAHHKKIYVCSADVCYQLVMNNSEITHLLLEFP